MKRFLLLAGLLLVVVVLNVTLHLHSQEDYLGDLLLENVDALAFGEIPSGGCVGNGSVDCPIGNIKVKYVMSGHNFEGFN